MGWIGEGLWKKKWMKMQKSNVFWAKTRKWYQYQKVVPVPMMQRASGTGTTQTGIGTTASNNPVCAYFCTVKSRIRIPIVEDPKK